MENQKKKRVSVLMYPEMERRIDALYTLHGFSSRNELVCNAVDFYTGFLESEHGEEYMNQTTLAFLQDRLERLEGRICKQLFRMCVETATASHVFAAFTPEIQDGSMERLRKQCIKDVRSTVDTIRYDSIYHFEHSALQAEEEFDEAVY